MMTTISTYSIRQRITGFTALLDFAVMFTRDPGSTVMVSGIVHNVPITETGRGADRGAYAQPCFAYVSDDSGNGADIADLVMAAHPELFASLMLSPHAVELIRSYFYNAVHAGHDWDAGRPGSSLTI